MGQRDEADAPPAPSGKRAPVQGKSGRRRLEGNRVGSNAGPHLPQRQRLSHMGVLDRPAVPCEAGQHGCAIAREDKLDEAWMIDEPDHVRMKRTESKTVARCQGWWWRPVLGAHAVIAGTKRNRDEARRVAE